MIFIARFIYKLIPASLKICYYKFTGKRRWSIGYLDFKFKCIKKIIHNPKIMVRFKNSEFLPKNYGIGLDERIIEYPWVLSRIPSKNGILLDVGSSLNFKEILTCKFLKDKLITILNLNPEKQCFWQKGIWQKGISYVFADVRGLPFQNDYFDYITCISVLEHVGMNNFLYTKNPSHKEENLFDIG